MRSGFNVMRFFAPIGEFWDDPGVSEVLINGPDEIWIERNGLLQLTGRRFDDAQALEAALTAVAQWAGRVFDEQRPILESQLPDGSRVEAVRAPIAEDGPVVSIRRFSAVQLTVDGLVAAGTISSESLDFLREAVRERVNIVVSGGTGSGKTSLLGALSALVPGDERFVVLEDTRELRMQQRHVVYLEARPADRRGMGSITIRDLLRATLRLRPDRIVVGEVRGPEALDLVQAMTSGHAGSMTTAHASSPADLMRRIETMAAMDESGLPAAALRAQIASAIQLIVQVDRLPDGRRVVTRITRSAGCSASGEYLLNPLFERHGAQLVPVCD